MRAAVYDRPGPAAQVLSVTEVDDPEPGPGEARVRVAWSGVNPTDVKGRVRGEFIPEGGVRIPHQDGAGVVDAVGSGVDASWVGKRVWVYHAAYERPWGTAATYVCLPITQVVALDAAAPIELGAALGIPYLTAYDSLHAGGTIDGATVLVCGGAGAVGVAAIQLARHAGARVVATVSSNEKAAVATEAGADAVVEYTRGDVTAALAAQAPGRFDRVVDVALSTNIGTYASLLADGAQVSAYARLADDPVIPFAPLMRVNATVRFVYVYTVPPVRIAAAIDGVTAALEDGVIAPARLLRYDLDDIVGAHEAVEAGALGKVIVRIP